MLLSLDWLRDFVDLPEDLDNSVLAHELTLRTVEVEDAVTAAGHWLDEAIVGRILDVTITSGPGSEATVQIGTAVVTAVCSGSITPGSLAAVFHDQDRGRWVILCPRDAGVEAMFPSERHTAAIDLSASGATLEPATVGARVAPLLGWDDTIIEIDNKSLTNRPDLWGHFGVARELAAIFDRPVRELPSAAPTIPARTDLIGAVDPSLCGRFDVIELTTGTPEEPVSPLLIRSRLARIGQRTLGFYADLTNYAMFAVGQPSHAYDRGRLRLPLSVTRSDASERRLVLTGSEVEIPTGTPTIRDADGTVAIAGVVGTRKTAVDRDTKVVLFEIGTFDHNAVRRSTLDLRVRTDASSRFEKALDTQAVDRCEGFLLHLLRRHDPTSTLTGRQSATPSGATEQRTIQTSTAYLNAGMGTDLTAAEIAKLLEKLDFGVEDEDGMLTVRAPSWRSTGDIEIPSDILEEVARMVGYDNLPPSVPQISLRPVAPRTGQLDRQIREFLAFRVGAQEILTYPWAIDRTLAAIHADKEPMLRIEGAPSEDRSHLRPSLVPNMLDAIEVNLPNFGVFRLFEIGTAYRRASRPDGEMLPRPELGHDLCAAFVGSDLTTLVREARGAVEGLGRTCRLDGLTVEPGSPPPWGDEMSSLRIVSAGKAVGHLAGIDLSRTLDMRTDRRVVIVELHLDDLDQMPSRDNRYVAYSLHPQTFVDLSVVVSDAICWADLSASVDRAAVPHMTNLEFVDEFRGPSVGANQRSITLRVGLGAPDRTLLSTDKAEAKARVLEQLNADFGLQERS